MPVTMTFGIDARAAAEVPAGRGRYVRELLVAMAALPEASDVRFELWAREPWSHPALDDDPRFSWRLVALPDPLWHLAVALRARGDAYLSTNSYLTAWATRIPTAVAVMDLVAFVDGAHAQARAARIERATIRPAIRRARALICISEATRADLVTRFPAAVGKATVVPLAADPALAGAPRLPPGHPELGGRPYVLAVGTLEPRKNLVRLIEAWSRLPDALRSEHVLALVGPRGWDDDAIVARARAAGDVRLLGRVSDDELHALYAGCACFAYPSLYEGFGLPVLEAMTAGAPVLTSDRSSLPEVAGDAALLVDPEDITAIAGGLERLLTDPALSDDLRRRGRERAREFSWDRCALEHLRVLTRIGGGGGSTGTGDRYVHRVSRTARARFRTRIFITRTRTRLLRILRLRDWVHSRRLDRERARRTVEERRGSDLLSRPALHDLDSKLDQLLQQDGGFFVEAGGHDGYTQSNTYYLARFRNWRGILVEPTPTLFELCRTERPESTIIQSALVDHDSDGTTVTMRFGDLMSAVAGSRDDEDEWTAFGLQTGWRDAYEAEVPARALSSIIDEVGAPEVDLLTLDVEGFEAQALRGLDLERHAPRWIVVEAHDDLRDRPPLDQILAERYENHGRISPNDLLYRRRDVPIPEALSAPGVLLS